MVRQEVQALAEKHLNFDRQIPTSHSIRPMGASQRRTTISRLIEYFLMDENHINGRRRTRGKKTQSSKTR